MARPRPPPPRPLPYGLRRPAPGAAAVAGRCCPQTLRHRWSLRRHRSPRAPRPRRRPPRAPPCGAATERACGTPSNTPLPARCCCRRRRSPAEGTATRTQGGGAARSRRRRGPRPRRAPRTPARGWTGEVRQGAERGQRARCVAVVSNGAGSERRKQTIDEKAPRRWRAPSTVPPGRPLRRRRSTRRCDRRSTRSRSRRRRRHHLRQSRTTRPRGRPRPAAARAPPRERAGRPGGGSRRRGACRAGRTLSLGSPTPRCTRSRSGGRSRRARPGRRRGTGRRRSRPGRGRRRRAGRRLRACALDKLGGGSHREPLSGGKQTQRQRKMNTSS